MTEAGLDVESAYNLTEIFAGLEPEEGTDTVSNMQRYQAVVTSGLSDREQLTALGTLMGESEYVKVETGYEFGVTPAQYIQARESVAEIDDNGSTSQDEATRAISSIQGLTVRERAVLWQLQNKSWKATNNPYDTITGSRSTMPCTPETRRKPWSCRDWARRRRVQTSPPCPCRGWDNGEGRGLAPPPSFINPYAFV